VLRYERLEQRRLLAADLQGREYVAGEILVQFAPNTVAAERAAARSAIGGQLAETIETATMKATAAGVFERIKIGNGVAIDQVIATLEKRANVKFAEPNYIYRPSVVSNDTYYTNGNLWGMYGNDSPTAVGPNGTTNQFGTNAERAWNDNVTGSSSVIVGVIDEGFQTTHPDLDANVWVNPYEINNGIDDDGNGYIDDINGWDFVSNDKTVYDGTADDHGTHVAGTIGAEGGNASGVVGVNWNVKMISAKFLGATGGTLANAIKAVDYLTDLKTRHGINIVASNNSWGGGGYSQSLHDAIIRGAKKDILFVAAAGNSTSNNDAGSYYPSSYNTSVGTSTQTAASYDAVISVASINSSGGLSSFSSYGATTVDIGAPGEGIISTVPVSTYANYSGTSMATPHVTGAAALYASLFPQGVAAATIKSTLLSTAIPTASLNGKTSTGARLNVYDAIQSIKSIEMDKAVYGDQGTITVTVRNQNLNLNSSAIETTTAEISSTTESTPEVITLTETGFNTGLFVGTISITSGPASADGFLQVANGDQIRAYNAAVNKTASAIADTAAPIISSLTSTPQGITAAIKWTTNEASTTQVLYGTTINYGTQYNDATLVTNHTASLTGLTAATVYYYEVRSRDAAGNVSSATGSFTTPPTKFFVVDDGTSDRMFEYTADGSAGKNSALSNSTNTASRGAAMTSAGNLVWVVDRNRNVYVYNTNGGVVGTWTAGSIASTATLEGIATDGTNIWIVDSKSDRVYYYANAALSTVGNLGTIPVTSSWLLGTGNTNPKDIVFGKSGTMDCLWVVNDANVDNVFRYVWKNGSLITATTGTDRMLSWNLNTANKSPTGITLDPSQSLGSLWVVDSGTDRIYEYSDARGTTAGTFVKSYPLSPGNTNPQGIADPPPSGELKNEVLPATASQTRPNTSWSMPILVTHHDVGNGSRLMASVNSEPTSAKVFQLGSRVAIPMERSTRDTISWMDSLARELSRRQDRKAAAANSNRVIDKVFEDELDDLLPIRFA
jgi:subtilisin family serine protease